MLRRGVEVEDKVTGSRRLLRLLDCFIIGTSSRCRRVTVPELSTGNFCCQRLVGVVFVSR